MGKVSSLALLLPVLCSTIVVSTWAQAPLTGNVTAVRDLLHRVLGEDGAQHFDLQLLPNDDDASNDFCLKSVGNKLLVSGTTASEVSAGIGWYLRHHCNMTIGWPRGGGSRLFVPTRWPLINGSVCKRRIVPWSYLMNVCTHSYSLAWYDWNDWEQFIDWMALSGINLMLAMTGQEEIQYKVFTKLGLQDKDIRTWFNGPAFLAWSRGQNEYGNNICGPLPRSWMKDQHELQRTNILPRLRSLGITGQLPAFQGNVPIQLAALYNDTQYNITKEGDTGWMDSLDPLFGTIADLWMETLIEDFGTDHWYQLDGYFDGSTAPWMMSRDKSVLRHGAEVAKATSLDVAYDEIPHDDLAYRRGAAAYMGLNRTDPDAVWSFQGWAIIGWNEPKQAAFFKGFVDSVPKGKLVVIGMSTNGDGEWKQWQNASYFGAPFVWTTVNNFGGTSGMKGDLSTVNRIPFDGLGTSTVFGTGASPEGIDQNPVYYEFVFDQNFRSAPVQDLRSHIIERSHRRYGLVKHDSNVASAWSLLVDSAYAQDLTVQDHTGISHLPPPKDSSLFEADRRTPKPVLCEIFHAWRYLITASEESDSPGFQEEPFVYDLVNLGREVLAHIATPASLNFSEATLRSTLGRQEIVDTGNFYIELLNDTDTLLATDEAFLLGPWIESARRWGKERYDCPSAVGTDCEHFFEWNARTQVTTWNPTSKESTSIPFGPIDYAAKHWSGLVRDYYGGRAALLLQQALKDEATGLPLNTTELARLNAQHAYKWTTAVNKYPTTPCGYVVTTSQNMYAKYKHWFSSCETPRVESSIS